MKQKSGFSGQLGFVFAAAGSAVGVVTYGDFHILQQKTAAVCFWSYTWYLFLRLVLHLLTTDIAIGRKTGKSAIYAYQEMKKENGSF